MISFCTWIKNRLFQFEQTFEANLERIGPDNEWIILDCGSDDGLIEWLNSRIENHPQVRLISVPTEFIHMSRLKNLSHSYATGDVLVNLDADNAIGENFCEYVRRECKPGVFLHVWSGNWSDGTCGRLVFYREDFWRIGGYDEGLLAAGNEDIDLRDRAMAYGYQIVNQKDRDIVGEPIPNGTELTMTHVEYAGSFSSMNHENIRRSTENIAAGRFVANLTIIEHGSTWIIEK